MTVRAGTAYRKIWRLVTNFCCSHNKVHCSEISVVLSNLLYHYFFHWIMAHFNFVISQNAKWGHASFYIDCHRMTVPENILLQKSTVLRYVVALENCSDESHTLKRVVGFWFPDLKKTRYKIFQSEPSECTLFWHFNGKVYMVWPPWCNWLCKCVCCSFKEPVVFDQSVVDMLTFGSMRSQLAGRTLYQSRIWSSTHERAAPAFERTISSRSLSRSLNSSMFINSTLFSARNVW